jgi:tripartite-type tricarboxylate transporter receptor subunit TctC
MAGELLKEMAGIDIVHVPFKGSSEARIDVIGGQVDMMFDATTTMKAFIDSGKVIGIATTGLEQSKVLTNLPTVAAAGVPGYQAVIWLGLVAPKGTPAAIVDQLNSTLETVMKDPALQASWASEGAVPVFMTPVQFAGFIQDDIVKWAKVVKLAGLKANG